MDRYGPLLRRPGRVRPGHVDLPHHHATVSGMRAGPPLHGNVVFTDQQPKNGYFVAAESPRDKPQRPSDLLLIGSHKLQAEELQVGSETPRVGFGEVPPRQFVLGQVDNSHQFGPRLPQVEGVQTGGGSPGALRQSELQQRSDFLLFGVHLPPERTAEQSHKFLPQIPEIQTR